MNTFNKKSLCVALAATGMLGAAGVAQAVNVSENGLGNVLIYPYYTVNKDINGNSFNTLMSVVNTTASTKAIKVRFREGRNSVEVLDFNVFLSPFDVWTAAITPTAAGGAQIATADKSCTIPTFPTDAAVPFRTLSMESTDNGVTRTSEGYFEIFEMATYADDSDIAENSKHSGGVPKDCSKINDTLAESEAEGLQGGLYGGVTILSPAGGGAWSNAATALDNFGTDEIYASTGSTLPSYNDADPVSNVIIGSNLFQSDWGTSGVDAVTAVLMANAVSNEYVLDVGSKSQTSWILTFPTKFAYVNGKTAVLPFTQTYTTKVGACEPFYGVVFDREEASPEIITGTDFSPQPKPGAGPTLCWEAQSVGFGTSNVFGSANHANVSTTNPSSGVVYRNGWSVFAFNNPAGANEHYFTPGTGNTNVVDLTASNGPTSGATVTYYGLPVIGFAAQTFQNDAVTVSGKTYLSTFGVTFPHHFGRSLNPAKVN